MGKKYTEEEGIAAIKYLQGLADIPETDDQARRGWRSFSDREKEFTMMTYEMIHKSAQPKAVVSEMIEINPEAKRRKKNDLQRNKIANK